MDAGWRRNKVGREGGSIEYVVMQVHDVDYKSALIFEQSSGKEWHLTRWSVRK